MQFLSFNEKKIFGEYFTSEDGLFLDMNSQEFVDFFAQFGVEIKNTPKYGGMGSSEKQRFCRFLEVESRNLIKKVLQEAHQYKKHFVEGRNPLEVLRNKKGLFKFQSRPAPKEPTFLNETSFYRFDTSFFHLARLFHLGVIPTAKQQLFYLYSIYRRNCSR